MNLLHDLRRNPFNVLMGSFYVLTFYSSLVFGQAATEMRMFSDSFISPSFEATQKSNYQFVGAHLKTQRDSDDSLQMDISGGLAIEAPLLDYLNITEFYFKYPQTVSETFYIGRKKMLWSELDSRWNLGVWQPIFKWNPLDPEQQGLSGLFWQLGKPLYSFVLFVSPLYLPSQGPSFEIQNGGFTKGNPWFHQPPQSVRIWNEATDMQYHFDRPNDSQIVMQNYYGAKLVIGENQNIQTRFSYLYGPDNVLALGYRGSLDLTNLKGNVELQPQVFYHSLAGADITFKISQWMFGLSGIFDHPSKEKLFDKDWSQPLFEDAFLISPFIEWDYQNYSVSLMRLDIFGGKVIEVGENLANAPLTNLYPFQQAEQISFSGHFKTKKRQHIFAALSYSRSEKNDFELFKINSRYQVAGLWSLYGEAQLLKAGPTNSGNVNDIAQFANNDRMMLGVSYEL